MIQAGTRRTLGTFFRSIVQVLLSLIYFKQLLNKISQERERARFILLSLLLIILFIQSFVDFSLHIPGIAILLVVILSFGLINFKNISD